MYRSSVSTKVLAALSAAAMVAVGCGGAPANQEEKAPAQARQAVTSAAYPVAAGRYHAAAVRSDGSVWVWGSNQYAQLGNGTVDPSPTPHYTPTRVQGLSGTFVSVAAATLSTLALRNDGTVWSWGDNGYGVLGDGTYTQRTSPVQVQGLPSGNPVVSIAADAFSQHVLALLSDGSVWSWGQNVYGQIGDGTVGTWNSRVLPVRVQTLDASLPYLTGVVAIAAGENHSLAVRSDGTVWTWGRNSMGQLGDGTQTDRSKAARILGLPTTSVITGQPVTAVEVAAGSGFSMVLLSDGTVYSFGGNGYGRLGYGTSYGGLDIRPGMATTPVRVGNLTNISRIECGSLNGVAVESSGAVWSWGSRDHGANGDGWTSGDPNPTPVQVPLSGGSSTQAAASHASGGDSFSVLMDSQGTIWTWGYNNYGQTGRSNVGAGGTGVPGTVAWPSP